MGVFFGVRPPINPFPDENTLLLLHGDEDPLIDSSQYQRSLTLLNGVSRSSVESKFNGYSMRFIQASQQYLTVPSSTDLRLIGNFTIDFWFFATSTGSDRADIFIQRPTSAAAFFEISINRTNDRVYVWLYNGSDISTFIGYTPNTWQHFALTGNQSIMRLYLNGIQGNTLNYNPSNMPAVTDTRIGNGWPGSGREYYNGYLDEFRISNSYSIVIK